MCVSSPEGHAEETEGCAVSLPHDGRNWQVTVSFVNKNFPDFYLVITIGLIKALIRTFHTSFLTTKKTLLIQNTRIQILRGF